MKFFTNRFYWLFCLLLLTGSGNVLHAQKKRYVKGNTESQMVFRLYACLANEDPYCYLSLFPDLDTLSKIVMKNANPSSKDYGEMAVLQRQPGLMFFYDSLYNDRLKKSFETMLEQGKKQGIHWPNVVPVRYELLKAGKTRDTLLEKIAPERFTGYFMMQDGLSRKQYIFAVADMFQIQGEWYGGYLGDVFEAESKDEYEDLRAAAARERKRQKFAPITIPDTTQPVAKTEEEEEGEYDKAVQKLIVERKLYAGMFDNEIPVQLYIRSLKGSCPEVICKWEAIYKFGDQDDYVLLIVSKLPDEKWGFIEEPPAGAMDLTLINGVFTGTWESTDGQTGYEVKLTEIPASAKKIERLDGAILELKGFGK